MIDHSLAVTKSERVADLDRLGVRMAGWDVEMEVIGRRLRDILALDLDSDLSLRNYVKINTDLFGPTPTVEHFAMGDDGFHRHGISSLVERQRALFRWEQVIYDQSTKDLDFEPIQLAFILQLNPSPLRLL
jgi:hypothetical protein